MTTKQAAILLALRGSAVSTALYVLFDPLTGAGMMLLVWVCIAGGVANNRSDTKSTSA